MVTSDHQTIKKRWTNKTAMIKLKAVSWKGMDKYTQATKTSTHEVKFHKKKCNIDLPLQKPKAKEQGRNGPKPWPSII